MTASRRDALSCCSISYSHPVVRWLLGDSLHPGGLDLTRRVAKLATIGPGCRVLDVGSGLGASAVHLAKTTGCSVVGVTLEEGGVRAGQDLARSHGVDDRVVFLQGDIQGMDVGTRTFDVALMECVLSTVPDKIRVLANTYTSLAPEGRLALTDVTLEGRLPDALQGLASRSACLGDARSLEEYGSLAESAGFIIERLADLPKVAESFLEGIRRKLLLAEVASKLGKLPVGHEWAPYARQALAEALDMARRGSLSYGLVIARKT